MAREEKEEEDIDILASHFVSFLKSDTHIFYAIAILISITFYYGVKDNMPRFIAALIVTLSAAFHDLIFNSSEGYFYFVSAALFDVVVVSILANFYKITSLVLNVIKYCRISFFINLAGWGIYEVFDQPVFYAAASFILYFYLILILTRSDDEYDTGRLRLASWASVFRINGLAIIGRREESEKRT